MEDVAVTERAKLWNRLFAAFGVVAAVGCVAEMIPAAPRPRPVYDAKTRQLQRLDWDSDGDGRVEQRTYFVNGTATRTEVDVDRDDRVDRWEYVDATAKVVLVGSSSANDGIEDTWIWTVDASGEVRIDRAQYRDRVIDRREFLRQDALIRAEEDANRDGSIDKWEMWNDGELNEAAFDTRLTTGRPDRRLVYERGRFAYMETDPDGDGRFERLASNQPGIRR